MGNNRKRKPDTSDKPGRKLSIKKETIRQLDTLTDDDLQRAAGGAGGQAGTVVSRGEPGC